MKFTKNPFKRIQRILITLFSSLCLSFGALFLSSCNKPLDLTEYVSEYRSNVFIHNDKDFSVKARSVEKEYPYVADGYKGELTHRTEIVITLPKGVEACSVRFSVDGKEYGGDASYDNVKQQFYFSCGANVSALHTLPLALTFCEEEKQLSLPSVRGNELTLQKAIDAVFSQEKELLKSLQNGKDFLGEIYVRLLYEDAPYFYVGVVDRNGNTTAFLLDGKSGKILAKRSS